MNIASQLSWVNLIYEIVEEAFILPLFFILGKSLGSKEELENKTRVGLIISGGSYLVLSILIITLARPLCTWMASDPSTMDATVQYIRLESIASCLSILSKFITVLLVTIGKDKYMYIQLGIQMALSMLLDTFLISTLPCSANIGVNGIAVANIVTSVVLVISAFIMLRREGIRVFREIPEGWLDKIYVSEHFIEEESHVKALQGKNYEVLANHVFESVSDTKTPQGILCLVKMPDYTLEEVLPKENEKAHLLILESWHL